MGVIKYYQHLLCNKTIVQSPPLKEPEEVFRGKPILNDSKDITLAEFDVDTKDAITAHHLREYRRKRFNLVLLPRVEILFDKILEGSDYWSGLLHDESPYS